jgi:hypothetical protein
MRYVVVMRDLLLNTVHHITGSTTRHESASDAVERLNRENESERYVYEVVAV